MADVGPNYALSIKKLEVDIEQEKVNIQKTEISLMELNDVKERHKENIKALRAGIADKEKSLAALRAEHANPEKEKQDE